MHGTNIQYVFSNVSFDAAEVGEMNLQPGNSLMWTNMAMFDSSSPERWIQ